MRGWRPCTPARREPSGPGSLLALLFPGRTRPECGAAAMPGHNERPLSRRIMRPRAQPPGKRHRRPCPVPLLQGDVRAVSATARARAFERSKPFILMCSIGSPRPASKQGTRLRPHLFGSGGLGREHAHPDSARGFAAMAGQGGSGPLARAALKGKGSARETTVRFFPRWVQGEARMK